ncbi:MAG: CpaF family protein [Gordonibacter sp.]|nr:CpaF family protein [Gordonibacter sp.]
MSLLDRVRQAGNDVSSGNVMEAEPGIDLLRAQVQMLVSADDVAAMQVDNPERARNEVRSACRRVFSHPRWSCLSVERRQCLESDLIDTIFGFGPLEGLLDDDTVTEIMVNGPKKLFFEQEGRLCQSTQEFVDDGQLRALIDRVLGPLGRRIDESSPMVNARLPQGHRVHAIIPPLALDGPVLTIRKFTKRVMTLEDMVAKGSFDETMRGFLTWAVRARKSIAVSGGTGSGKTTLLNALSCVISPEERIITIEDSAELRFLEHPHVVRLEARPRNAEGCGEVSIRDLVTNALRMRPDRIVVGECRGLEALDMLQAMNTGHDGSLTTLHANSPEESIARLTTMVRYGADLPVDVIEANIASAIDLVVQTTRSLDGSRRVSEVVAFSYDREKRCCAIEPLFKRGEGETQGRWLRAPLWLTDLPSRGNATNEEVEAWMRACCLAV